MRLRNSVTLFPFLSVLISTMGVLSFLAVTFLLFAQQDQQPKNQERDVDVRWVGAPPHVRPILVEVLPNELRVHGPTWSEPQVFPLKLLADEVKLVKTMRDEGIRRIGGGFDRYQLWLYLKNEIATDDRLRESFTMAMHKLELYNLSGAGRQSFQQRYPILLVYAGAVQSYELASFVLDVTTQLNVGLEPMLKGWKLPYGRSS